MSQDQLIAPHDALTQERIRILCESILSNTAKYSILIAPSQFIRQRELNEHDLNQLFYEMTNLKWDLLKEGFLPRGYSFYLQPDGKVAITDFDMFGFKILRPDGSWFGLYPSILSG